MTELKSGKIVIEVEPVTGTLRNIADLKAWRTKLAQCEYASIKKMEAIVSLIGQVPDLGERITMTGAYNQTSIAARIKAHVEGGTDADTAKTMAEADLQSRLITIAADSPEVAKAIFFPDIDFPDDAGSIAIGIKCIKETFNAATVKGKDAAKLLKSALDSDFWQDIEVKGVQTYCNNFCALHK